MRPAVAVARVSAGGKPRRRTQRAPAQGAPKPRGPKPAGQLAAKKLNASGQVKGHGGFFSDVWNQGKTLLGQGLHRGIDFLSGRAKGLVKTITGQGSYKMTGSPIEYNSLYAGASVVPKFGNGGESGNIVQHRESLGLISSSVGFARTSMTINPGLPPLSWLPRIAPAWQRWKLHGAIIEWVPRVPDINVNAGGSVVLSARYDLTTAAPQSIVEAESSWGAITGRPMDQMAMPVECKGSLNPTNVLNVRFGALPAGANAQFFDHCIIDVCTFGQAGVVNVGEVFITFEIEFMFPTAETITNSLTSCLVANCVDAVPATPYGTVWTVRPGSAFTPTFTSGAALTVDFVGNPLPVGSTWMALLVSSNNTAVGVSARSLLALGADLALYTPVFKQSTAADTGQRLSVAPGDIELGATTFRVVAASGNQTLLFTAMTFVAATTGCNTLVLLPIVSTLTQADAQMRHRFPQLYELSDMLGDLRQAQFTCQARLDDDESKILSTPSHPVDAVAASTKLAMSRDRYNDTLERETDAFPYMCEEDRQLYFAHRRAGLGPDHAYLRVHKGSDPNETEQQYDERLEIESGQLSHLSARERRRYFDRMFRSALPALKISAACAAADVDAPPLRFRAAFEHPEQNPDHFLPRPERELAARAEDATSTTSIVVVPCAKE